MLKLNMNKGCEKEEYESFTIREGNPWLKDFLGMSFWKVALELLG
jgi:hypothetical protein